jgi:1,4-alpha-glucan branching enzyme
MQGCFALVLHAHLPFVRHPEHERFLEETWLFEAITEVYVPLLKLLEGWQRDRLSAPLTLTLTPPLCAMLRDPLLQSRYRRHLNELIDLTEKEIHRTAWQKPLQQLALFYRKRFEDVREFYAAKNGDLVAAFRALQDQGRLEIITSAATHALLPLLANHPPSLRAQILVARDDYRACFGRDPRGIWLPECAYAEGIDAALREAGLGWFILEGHGVLHAQPRPRYGVFAPIITPAGLAAFGRDRASANQVWSRNEGYPGDPRYRDFYRDIGFDLDLDYLKPYLLAPGRGFTGLKYYRITGANSAKEVYEPEAARRAADEHAGHFLQARIAQMRGLGETLGRAPLALAPYDAELFGHWWYEGPEFLDFFVRKACCDQNEFVLTTPEDYLRMQPTQQAAQPAASSWGDGGYLRVWINEKNAWIYSHRQVAQERMSELARMCGEGERRGEEEKVAEKGDQSLLTSAPTIQEGLMSAPTKTSAPIERALRQAARELLLAQASDWPFILRTGTSPEYARQRVTTHLLRFTELYGQLKEGTIDEQRLGEIERQDNIFPQVNWRYWGPEH